METELNKKNDKFKYLKITTVICLIAVALSFAGCGASANSGSSSSGKSYASSTIIKGSENSKPISVSSFFKNVGKNTGIYKMIHTPTAAELAEEKASKEAVEPAKEEQAAQAAADLAKHPVKGWQRLIMLAIGFLIV
jgi:oxaloacetate decarboxylase beta subunit